LFLSRYYTLLIIVDGYYSEQLMFIEVNRSDGGIAYSKRLVPSRSIRRVRKMNEMVTLQLLQTKVTRAVTVCANGRRNIDITVRLYRYQSRAKLSW